ncbi:MAG TPA: L,D-transpeptidase family protein [Miltoncostaeaceae bacterium]|nr:L,D-transpeptidase family protein [Miltoncostaeaceae bacterium]
MRVVTVGRAVCVAVLASGGTALAQTTPTTPAPPPVAPAPPLAPGVIAPGVRIAGVDVSGLTRRQAELKVAAQVVAGKRRPLVVVARGRRIPIDPTAAGYRARVDRAVQGALNVARTQPPGPVDIPLTERVERATLRRVVEWRTGRLAVPARDATTRVRGRTLVMTPARGGTRIDVDRSVRLLEARILNRRASTVVLPTERVRPAVTTPPTAILIDRGRFRLTLARNGRLRTFPVAVGQAAYPTPSGDFRVVNMQRNPTWYPPDSRWAAGLGPVPPGAGNPLGTRWIGISSPGIGMHGTPAPSSIGTRASHGCIRMYMRDVETLFALVSIGTPVHIR